MTKFKGKFREPCRVNREDGWMRLIREYEAGYEEYRHCGCDVCELSRQENGVSRCENKSCDGCKNLVSGKKIRDWATDLYRGADKAGKE